MIEKDTNSRDIAERKRWAFIVGINNYEDDEISGLKYCVKDARDVHGLLLSHNKSGYEIDRTRLIISENPLQNDATRLNILRKLDEFASLTDTDDLLLFYFAGHGVLIDGEAYLIPSDARNGSILRDTVIPVKRIKEIVREAKARQKVLILDACHLGAKILGRSPEISNKALFENVFDKAEGLAVLASATQDAKAWEDPSFEQGVFTHFLLEGLKGAAKTTSDRFVTLDELFKFVAAKVNEWSEKNQKVKAQKPNLEQTVTGDFVIFPLQKDSMDSTIINSKSETRNPIRVIFPQVVRDTVDFYDREKEMQFAKKVFLSKSQKLIIFKGERCVGKTSLLIRLQNLLKEDAWYNRGFRGISIEPYGVSSCEEFSKEIWHGLLNIPEVANLQFPGKDQPFEFSTYNQFMDRLAHIHTQLPELTSVIFIDEFDKFAYADRQIDYRRISGLIQYVVEQTDFPIIFCVSILKDLPTDYGSPLSQLTMIQTVLPFEKKDMVDMVSSIYKGYARLEEDCFEWLYKYTGGHPYFIKLILQHLTEKLDLSGREQDISIDLTLQAALNAEQDVQAYKVLEHIYSEFFSDYEKYTLLWLSSAVGNHLSGKEISGVRTEVRNAVAKLIQRNYLLKDESDTYWMKMGIFGNWLKSWSGYELELERLEIKKAELSVEIVKDGICIDLATRRVYVDGQLTKRDLTELEYKALSYFSKNIGIVISKDVLTRYVYDEDYIGDYSRIDKLISRIRDVIDDKEERGDKKEFKYLKSVRGSGYRLNKATFIQSRLPNTEGK